MDSDWLRSTTMLFMPNACASIPNARFTYPKQLPDQVNAGFPSPSVLALIKNIANLRPAAR